MNYKYLQFYSYFRAKMPSDPLEAELLAMAGAAIGADDNLLGKYNLSNFVCTTKKSSENI